MTERQDTARLVVTEPAQYAGRVMAFSQPQTVIGRGAPADIVFDDEHVSRRHARVTIDPSGSVTITDLNSTSGTFVNEEKLTGPHELRAGEVIRLGKDLRARFEPATSTEQADSPTEKPRKRVSATRGATRASRRTPKAQRAVEKPVSQVKIGLRSGDRGFEVEHLQRVLRSAGLEIAADELEQRRFGPSTLAAMQIVQGRANVPATSEIDEATLATILELQERITIDVHEDGEPKPAPKRPDPTKGIVTGTLTDQDGAGIAHTRVTLLSMTIRGHSALSSATTDASGAYHITYKRSAPLNLAVTATDAARETIATSATVFAAPPQTVIDFTTAPDGVIRQPSQYTKLQAAVNAGLQGISLLDLQENSTTHELTFLANSIGVPFGQVAYLYIADQLAQQNGLLPQTLYGLFAEGTPATLNAALADLPDTGIDTAFTTQVFTLVLGRMRATLDAALTAAVNADVLGASYVNSQPAELDKIDTLRVTNTGTSPENAGKTRLNAILAAGNGAGPAPTTASGVAYTVTGTVTSPALPAIGGLAVDLVDNNVGAAPTTLASSLTAPDGSYAFYRVVVSTGYLQQHQKMSPDLQVQVSAADGGPVLASSVIRYQASTTESLNVVLPAGATGLPSEYELLTQNLSAVYSGDLARLKETGSQHDITYLANTTGWDARVVAFASQAAHLATVTPTLTVEIPAQPATTPAPAQPAVAGSVAAQPTPPGDGAPTLPISPPAPVPVAAPPPASVPAPLLYALLRAGVPADPDAMFGTDITTVKAIWAQAISQNIIPASLASGIDSAAASFTAIGVSRALNAPLVAGTSTLGELLQTALDGNTVQQNQFATLLTTYRDDPTTLWEQATVAFGPQTTSALQLDGKLAYLAINNAPLIGALHQANAATPLTSTLDLVTRGYYQATAWEPLLANVAPPPQITGSTLAEQKATYAELLAAQVRLAYPTATVAQLVATDGLGITDTTQRGAVADFLNTNQATFDIGAEPVGQFLARTNTTLDATATAHIERIQRVRQITQSIPAMTALTAAGVDSAFAVVRMGQAPFVQQMTGPLGADVASAIYARALAVHATTVHVTVAYTQARKARLFPDPQRAIIDPVAGLDGSAAPAAAPPPAPPDGSPTPDVQIHGGGPAAAAQATLAELFGNLDYATCEDCLSVTSPAAYLVSLLDFIDNGNPADPNNPLVALRARRPDIFALLLTCENTSTALPYIDLVNETLAFYVANNEQWTQVDALGQTVEYAGYNDDGTVSSAQLIATPQNDDNDTGQAAHTLLARTLFPEPLPFDYDLAQLRAYMASLNTAVHTVMRVMRAGDDPLLFAHASGGYGWHDILIERLAVSPREYQLLTDSGSITLTALFASQASSPSIVLSQMAVLSKMAVLQEFSRSTGVCYDDIVAILATRFINPAYRLLAPFQALGVNLAAVQRLHSGAPPSPRIKAQQFRTLVGQANPNIVASTYGGDIVGWVLANYDALMRLLLIDVDPTDLYNTTKMSLQHLGGDLLRQIDLVKLILFIRLWHKLGLSITATDNLITAFYQPPDPSSDADLAGLDTGMQTVLHSAGLVFEAIDLAGLDPTTDLDSLLTCWGAPIGTNGADSLYSQLFLNPTLTAAQTGLFQLDAATGHIKNPPALADAKPALCAALNVTGTEFDLLTGTTTNPPIMPGLGLTLTTPVTLDVVTDLYKHAWLARTLNLSVLELLALGAATGIDPFTPAFPSTTADVSAPLLDFIRLTQNLAAAGLAPVQALYLLWNIDLSGVSAPPSLTTVSLAIALRAAFAAIDAQFALTANPSVASVKALMTQVLGAAASDFYFGLLAGTFTTTVGFSSPTGALPAAVLTASNDATKTPRLGYNDLTKELSYVGYLDRITLAGMLTQAGTDVDLVNHLTALNVAYQASVDAFFATYDTPIDPTAQPLGLQILLTAYEAAIMPPPLGQGVDPTVAMTTLLTAVVPALAARRKQQQALSVATGAAGVDSSFGPALLLDNTLIPAANTATAPAVDDLVALGQGGLTARFWLANDRSAAPPPAPDTTAPVPVSLTYNASTAPPNPLPPPAPGAAAIAATWTGYLAGPQTGDYGLAVQTDAGATVTIWVNGSDVHMTPDPTGTQWKNQDPITLTSATAMPITIAVDGLPFQSGRAGSAYTFEVTWLTTGTGWQPIPPAALYADTLITNLQMTNLRFLKTTNLASDLGLLAPEIVYLAKRPDLAVNGQFWTAALPTVPVTGPASAPALPAWTTTQQVWTPVLDALLIYAGMKAQYSANSTHLLDALTDITAGQNGAAELCSVTGWDTDSLSALATQFQLTDPQNPITRGLTMAQLSRLRDAFSVITGCRLPAATLIGAANAMALIAANETTPSTANETAASAAVQQFQAAVCSRYDQAGWLDIATTINNQIRVQLRDALVAYILNTSGPNILTALGIQPTANRLPTADDLYNYFLMDVEMSTCMQTSRIRLALSSVQQFIERCLHNLEDGIDPVGIDPNGEWPMRKTYRVWQAALEVFLTPQDWMVESLRDDQSEIFRDCVGQLQKGDIDADTAVGIFHNYLGELSGIAQLDPCGLYYGPAGATGVNPTLYIPGATVADQKIHVIARSTGATAKYYYRYWDGTSWWPWVDTKLPIEDKPLQIVEWNGRLLVFWLKLQPQPSIDPNQISGSMNMDPAPTATPLETAQALVTQLQSQVAAAHGSIVLPRASLQVLADLLSTSPWPAAQLADWVQNFFSTLAGELTNLSGPDAGVIPGEVQQLQQALSALVAGGPNASAPQPDPLSRLGSAMQGAVGTNTSAQPAVVLCYSEYRNGSWQPMQTSDVTNPLLLTSGAAGSFDRTSLELRLWTSTNVHDRGLYIEIAPRDKVAVPWFALEGFYGWGTYGFVLQNTNSVPLRMGPPGNEISEGGAAVQSLFQPANVRMPGTTSPDTLQFDTTGKIVTGQSQIRVQQAQLDVADQRFMPFFAADTKNTFWVSMNSTQKFVPLNRVEGFGTQANQDGTAPAGDSIGYHESADLTTMAQVARVGASRPNQGVDIPPLLVGTPGQSSVARGLTAQLSNPSRAQAALAAAPPLRVVLGTASPVAFNGTAVTPTGAAPTPATPPPGQ
jgi:hypothetical protein